jgi:hypothetical protein
VLHRGKEEKGKKEYLIQNDWLAEGLFLGVKQDWQRRHRRHRGRGGNENAREGGDGAEQNGTEGLGFLRLLENLNQRLSIWMSIWMSMRVAVLMSILWHLRDGSAGERQWLLPLMMMNCDFS